MAQVRIGRVVKAVGIRGELKLDPSDDFWEEALDSRSLALRLETAAGVEQRAIRVEKHRPHKGGYVIAVSDVRDRNAAEGLVGAEVVIDSAHIDVELPRRALPFQILGAKALSTAGEVLGEVTAVFHSAAHDLYEISGPRGTFMVPAVSEFVKSVDEEKREIVIEIIPGLIDEETEA